MGSVGCIAKSVIYKGIAAHAGGSPWNGKNALYAATCGLNVVNAILAANKKVNRVLCGAALSIGTNIEIIDIPGYARADF